MLVALATTAAFAAGTAACNSTASEPAVDAAAAVPDATLPPDGSGQTEAGGTLPDAPSPEEGGQVEAGSDASIDASAPDDGGALSDGFADAATASSAVIGPAGGTLVHPLGATLKIPAAALSTPTLITLTPIAAPTNAAGLGSAFEVDPPGLSFAMPAEITLAYDPSDVPDGAAASSLAIEQSTDTGATFTALATTPDTAAHRLTAPPSRAGDSRASSSRAARSSSRRRRRSDRAWSVPPTPPASSRPAARRPTRGRPPRGRPPLSGSP